MTNELYDELSNILDDTNKFLNDYGDKLSDEEIIRILNMLDRIKVKIFDTLPNN